MWGIGNIHCIIKNRCRCWMWLADCHTTRFPRFSAFSWIFRIFLDFPHFPGFPGLSGIIRDYPGFLKITRDFKHPFYFCFFLPNRKPCEKLKLVTKALIISCQGVETQTLREKLAFDSSIIVATKGKHVCTSISLRLGLNEISQTNPPINPNPLGIYNRDPLFLVRTNSHQTCAEHTEHQYTFPYEPTAPKKQHRGIQLGHCTW